MEQDILKDYRNTNKLYAEIKKYMLWKKVTKQTPFPVVAVYINSCVKKYKNKEDPPNFMYPKNKVIRLCFYYLDSIGYEYE
jgi:hypothetical protein